jgi:hypothetical protein
MEGYLGGKERKREKLERENDRSGRGRRRRRAGRRPVPGRAAASTCTERRAGRREEEVARGEGATRGRKKRTIVFPL